MPLNSNILLITDFYTSILPSAIQSNVNASKTTAATPINILTIKTAFSIPEPRQRTSHRRARNRDYCPVLMPGQPATHAGNRSRNAKCVTFNVLLRYTLPMPRTKVSTLNLRINPAVKRAIRQAAALEHRSIANMVEVLIRRHCDDTGIVISDSQTDPTNGEADG